MYFFTCCKKPVVNTQDMGNEKLSTDLIALVIVYLYN